MKRLIAATLLFTTLLASAARAQDEGQARDLFLSYTPSAAKGKPGARIKLELLRDGRRRFVPLDTVFQAGDKVKLHFAVNFPAYVVIYNLGSSGELMKLFPLASERSYVAAATDYVVPRRETEWFEFDETPGTEKLSFIFSAAQLRRPVKQPAPKAKPAPKQSAPAHDDIVVVRPGGRSLEAEEAQALNDEAQANGRDLNRVQVKDEHYVLSTPQKVRNVLGIVINLNHR